MTTEQQNLIDQIREILTTDAMDREHAHYGIRFDNHEYQTGDICETSKQWEDGDIDDAIATGQEIIEMDGTYVWDMIDGYGEPVANVDAIIEAIIDAIGRRYIDGYIYIVAADSTPNDDALINERLGPMIENVFGDAEIIARANIN